MTCCATTDNSGNIVGAATAGAVACTNAATGTYKKGNCYNPACSTHQAALGTALGAGFSWVTPAPKL